MKSREVVVLSPWNETPYEGALKAQLEAAQRQQAGWLLFCCQPTITKGKRATQSDILFSSEELAKRGVRVLEVDRGGQVTYHGPGQIIGFPFGTLADHTGDPRGVRAFVVGLKQTLEAFLTLELERSGSAWRVDAAQAQDTAGVWLARESALGRLSRKVVSIGLGFGREAIRHGFALNVEPVAEAFSAIHPCGEAGAVPASVYEQKLSDRDFAQVLERLIDFLKLGR